MSVIDTYLQSKEWITQERSCEYLYKDVLHLCKWNSCQSNYLDNCVEYSEYGVFDFRELAQNEKQELCPMIQKHELTHKSCTDFQILEKPVESKTFQTEYILISTILIFALIIVILARQLFKLKKLKHSQ